MTPGQFKLQVKKAASDSTTASSDSLVEACTADAFEVVSDAAAAATTPAPVGEAVATAQPVAAAPTAPTPAPAGAASTPAPQAATDAPVAPATDAPVAAITPAPQAMGLRSASSSSVSTTASGETPGTPPTPVPARVTCDPTVAVTYSYKIETSTAMPLITIEHESGDRDGGGCTNLSGLWEWLSTKPTGVPEVC